MGPNRPVTEKDELGVGGHIVGQLSIKGAAPVRGQHVDVVSQECPPQGQEPGGEAGLHH